MNTTSMSLLERVRRLDNEQAWERFVQLYTPLIFHLARVSGLSQSDAGDLVQDVFAVLIQKLPDFEYDQRKSFRGWLRTIALNKCRDALRRNGRSRKEQGGLEQAQPFVDDDAELFSQEEYRNHLVQRAMRLMKAEFQTTTWRACWEHVVKDRSAPDVARELGITPNAVYLAKGRVLRRLREELDGLLD